MKQQVQRPDTPLAATPDPMPVSAGMQMPAPKPVTKYQAVADAAIQQIQNKPKTMAPSMNQPDQQQSNQQ